MVVDVIEDVDGDNGKGKEERVVVAVVEMLVGGYRRWGKVRDGSGCGRW